MTELVSSTINMFSSRKETLQQFARFFLVGISNTAVDFCIYLTLTRLFPFFETNIYVANTISFAAAATWSYFANRNWTFKQTSKVSVREMSRFYISTVSAFLLNTFALFAVVHLMSGHDVLGKVLGSLISMLWNFSLNKLWVFNRS